MVHRYTPLSRSEALVDLRRWIRDMPGGQYLPDDVLDRDIVHVCIDGNGDDERLLWRLFAAIWTPFETSPPDHQRFYAVPRIVADCLSWYGDGDNWWAEEVAA